MQDELISRQAAIDACDQSINLFEAVDRIKELPPVNQQKSTEEATKEFKELLESGYYESTHKPKKLEQTVWKLVYRDCDVEFYLCTKCNEGRAIIDGDNYKSLDEFKICPHCGAKMIEPQESEKT